MRRDDLLAVLFPPEHAGSPKSKEELLQHLADGASRLREQTKKALSELTEKERRVLALRFSGDSPEDERGRELLREVEQGEKDADDDDQ